MDNAADSPGVYYLYDGDELIYIGSSETSVRDRLQDHQSGAEGNCTQAATSYAYELSDDPVALERQQLLEFRRRNRRLPRCNEVIP